MSGGAAIMVSGLSYRYPGSERWALCEVSLTVEGSRHLVVIGPNGSGKSTLLRCVLGRLRPGRGDAVVLGRSAGAWRPRELARAVGVVPQEEALVFPMTVWEAVAMGRYPHLGAWRREGRSDRAAVERAIERCDVAELRARRIDALSGGERQRVRIARALAQEPRILVLDEPTVHLDVRHEMEIFELVRGLVAEAGLTVVTVTHNLSLSARYADSVALLKAGRLVAEGPPASVLRPEILESAFEWPVAVERDSLGDLVVIPRARIRDGHRAH